MSTDAQLLERFDCVRDEAAFEELVRRHGPMVLQTCQRQLHDLQLAEDAFQATFIVLARKAGVLARPRSGWDSVGGWLHTVATRIAARANRNAVRRRDHEEQLKSSDVAGTVTGSSADWHDLRPLLDEELHKLPEKYRAPLVLCYLEGKTYDEAAQQLQWPTGTLKTQLFRGRDALRGRLARRGVTLSGAALAAGLEQATAHAALTPVLIRAALPASQGGAGASALAAALADAAVQAMSAARLKAWAALGVLVVAAAVGFVGAWRWLDASAPVASSPGGDYVRQGALGIHPDLMGLMFAADGKTIVSQGRGKIIEVDGTPQPADVRVKVWDSAARRELAAFKLTARILALAPDGRTLAVTQDERGVQIIDTRTGNETVALAGLTRQVTCAAYAPDGRSIAVAENAPYSGTIDVPGKWDGTWGQWDTATGKRLQSVPYRSGIYQQLTWSPDGKTLAALRWPVRPDIILKGLKEAGTELHAAHGVLIDAATGQERATFPGVGQAVCRPTVLTFTPDSRWLLGQSGPWYGPLGDTMLIDVATGERKSPPTLREQTQFIIGFRSDGASLFEVKRGPGSTQTHELVSYGIQGYGSNGRSAERTLLRIPVKRAGTGLNLMTTVIAVSPNARSVAIGQWEGEIELWGEAPAR